MSGAGLSGATPLPNPLPQGEREPDGGAAAATAFLGGRVVLHAGDCLDVVRGLADNSVDAVVTDPPYALVSIGKRFGKAGAAAPKSGGATGVYKRAASGFMGKAWDNGERAFAEEFWREIFRVLKPGGHVAAFAGTRTYHRLACAIEDGGFEIRDQLAWAYASGFPKSHDVSKGIDKALGAERAKVVVPASQVRNATATGGGKTRIEGATRPWIDAALQRGFHEAVSDEAVSDEAVSDEAVLWQGWGTALKPAWEPICLARKPLSETTVAANVLRWGTGAVNVDGCRVEMSDDCASKIKSAVFRSSPASVALGTFASDGADKVMKVHDAGRWPANIMHDGSGLALEAFGAASRVFFSAKADADDRIGSKHPTVKPVDMMQWLCRLVTPPARPSGSEGVMTRPPGPDGALVLPVVLDPFAGTGTTGEAAWREGFSAILIEREAEYRADIARRMAFALAGPQARKVEIAKQRPKPLKDDGPNLFGDGEDVGGGDVSTVSLLTRNGGGAASGTGSRPGASRSEPEKTHRPHRAQAVRAGE